MRGKEIKIKNLHVGFPTKGDTVFAVRGMTINFFPHRVTAILGESGSGKSVLGMAILNLLPKSVVLKGEIWHGAQKVRKGKDMGQNFYGNEVGLIPQNPLAALNPSLTIYNHLKDGFHQAPHFKNRNDCERLLSYFGFSEPQKILSLYPHELSGGMRQRVLCALTISTSPHWIIADEPTKGLDLDLRDRVIENLEHIKHQDNHSMLIITHDVMVARKLCDDCAIMYDGLIVEHGRDVLAQPLHPYTKGFLASLPENGFQTMEGVAPGPFEKREGCSFAKRCKFSRKKCFKEEPPLFFVKDRKVKCFLYDGTI